MPGFDWLLALVIGKGMHDEAAKKKGKGSKKR